jgi:hypothetical protein
MDYHFDVTIAAKRIFTYFKPGANQVKLSHSKFTYLK